MNFTEARYKMVEQQVRPCNINDESTLNLMREIARENFVPAHYRNVAYADINIPLGENAYELSPITIAKMLEAINLRADNNVLEINSGCGYMSALIGKQVSEVLCLQKDNKVYNQACAALSCYKNIRVRNPACYFEEMRTLGLFDVIFVHGETYQVPEIFFQHLSDQGRLLAVVGRFPVFQVILFTKKDKGFSKKKLFETSTFSHSEFPQPSAFTF